MTQSSDQNQVFDNFDDSIARSSVNSLVGSGTQLVSKVVRHSQFANELAEYRLSKLLSHNRKNHDRSSKSLPQ